MSQKKRAPIITVMGHVDHGKTTLLDYIRKTRVQAGEAGGITQHIGAYQIDFKSEKITFIDTPGHAAFNKMRERGANITDIVILVISAKDGVQPQTVESIEYIKKAKVPFVVALNKMDLDGAKPDQTKAKLAEHEVVVQEYGGDIDTVEISAKTGKGIDKLLETVTVLAEILELKADSKAPLEAVVVESTKDKHKGSIARVIVKQGTLTVKQELLTEDGMGGRVRSLIDEHGKRLKEVEPGEPAEILGLNQVPEVGTIIKDAKCDYKKGKSADNESSKDKKDEFSWDDLDFEAMMGDKEKLNLIIRADVKGTLEAIVQTIDEDTIEIVSAEVGALSDGDIEMAEITNSLIIVFGQKVPRRIKKLAVENDVRVKQYDIIYHLIEDLEEKQMELMDPHFNEKELGRAEIKQIFEINKEEIAGIKVKTGEINRNDLLHLERDGEYVADPVISSLKHGKDNIKTVKAKNEAGISFKNKNLKFKKGDIIVAYKKEI
ncbi:MAG: translation initiation factor IF-2 [Patescibacteria group bacterium]|nr:translation initiation factor IF-2 [Patescibacteria group bacterium]